MPGSNVWHSVATVEPHSSWHLGLGAVYFPSEALLRAVNTRTNNMVKDFGQVYRGKKTLYVDYKDCSGVS